MPWRMPTELAWPALEWQWWAPKSSELQSCRCTLSRASPSPSPPVCVWVEGRIGRVGVRVGGCVALRTAQRGGLFRQSYNACAIQSAGVYERACAMRMHGAR
jgi:hypothetical protein